ncbi:MAG: hypothetical protein ACF8R7_08965 [Phycisphaerales bacterium JB039]
MTQYRPLLLLLAAALLGACASSKQPDFAKGVTDERPQIIQASRLDDQAQAAYEEGKLPQAERLWLEAIATADDYWVPYHNIGVFYAEEGNYIGAVQQLRRAAELAPGDHRPLYHLGVAYFNAGYARQSLDAFRRSHEVAGNDIRTLRGILSACRALDYADPETLDAMRAALLIEQDPAWRDSFQREVRRQERQLDEAARRG